MFKRIMPLGAVIAIALLVAGCYRDFGPVVAEPAPIPSPAAATHLHVGDQVMVTVYGESALTGVYTVTPAGFIDLPLVGMVKVVGLTPAQLERIIANRYVRGKYLQQAKVTVVTVQYQPFYIFGEVIKPGQYAYPGGGLNVLTAITTAGGLTYRGSKDRVLIERAGQRVWNEYPMLSSVTVLPGDLIRVPERYF